VFADIALSEPQRSTMNTDKTTSKAGAGAESAQWSVSDVSKAKSLRDLEFQDNKGEWQHFVLLATKERIVFGGACNVGFIESGYIDREECESLDETLQEMLADLETYYNDGPQYVSRIVCNERM
jgi:hypothetical protein